MAQYIGQVQGEFNPYYDLMAELGNGRHKITKIGIQLDNAYRVKINGVEFEMGKTGILEFEDVLIEDLTLKHVMVDEYGNELRTKIPVIIDYICEKEET